jgi:hypothetical protein
MYTTTQEIAVWHAVATPDVLLKMQVRAAEAPPMPFAQVPGVLAHQLPRLSFMCMLSDFLVRQVTIATTIGALKTTNTVVNDVLSWVVASLGPATFAHSSPP